MKILGNQVRKGNVIEFEGGLWRVSKAEATKTGKSGAYQQVEMKHVTEGTKKNVRFRASESVEKAFLESRDYTFLYQEGDKLHFMSVETYEQIEIPEDIVAEQVVFLTEGMAVVLEFYQDTPLNITLPQQVTLTVTETEPSIKGQTATSSYKPALLSNGIRIGVPPFVNEGDEIVVDTSEQTYVRRAD